MGGGAKILVSGIFFFGLPHGGSDSMTIEVGAHCKFKNATVDLPSNSSPYFSIIFTRNDTTVWHVFGCSCLTIAAAVEG